MLVEASQVTELEHRHHHLQTEDAHQFNASNLTVAWTFEVTLLF